jgi:hypothetical protein
MTFRSISFISNIAFKRARHGINQIWIKLLQQRFSPNVVFWPFYAILYINYMFKSGQILLCPKALWDVSCMLFETNNKMKQLLMFRPWGFFRLVVWDVESLRTIKSLDANQNRVPPVSISENDPSYTYFEYDNAKCWTKKNQENLLHPEHFISMKYMYFCNDNTVNVENFQH